jgi:iron complex outermembrane receptor protein
MLAGYTYIDPRFAEFDPTPVPFGQDPTEGQLNASGSSVDYNILKYRSRHTMKFDMESRYKKVSVGLAIFYASHMEAIDAIFETLVVPGLQQFRENNNRGYQLYNVRVAYNFSERQKLSFLANNILNTAYSIRPGLMEAPINFTLRFDYGF